MTSTKGKNLASETATRLARLVRYTSEAGLSAATRVLVKELLLRSLGRIVEEEASQPKPVAAVKEPVPPREPRRQAAVATEKPKVESRRRDAEDARGGAAQIELRIRQLVEADANWGRMEPLAWELYAAKPGPETAAKILELAFLHGAADQISSVLVRLKATVKGFYPMVHVAVRAHLVARLWREGGVETVATILFKDKDEDYLQPIERLFVFQSMAAGAAKDVATPYIYFQRYKREILDASSELGAHVGLKPPRFSLMVGKMAIELGRETEACELLERIGPNEPEYHEALRLMLHAKTDSAKGTANRYEERLLDRSGNLDRIALLAEFLATTRQLGGFRDHGRPALNVILKNPLEWLSQEPEAWAALSRLLVANRDLEQLLPHMFEVFKANATRFHGPMLDVALWQGLLTLDVPVAGGSPRDQYWHGVALLHNYLSLGLKAEEALWRAREYIAAAKKSWRAPLPLEWRELHKAAAAWVAKNHYMMEADRARMLRQMRVALDPENVATSDVQDYLEQEDLPPVSILGQIQILLAAKKAHALERRLILKRAQVTHLTNADLERMWQLTNVKQEGDLSWRVATVLHARRALSPQVRHAWEISGEKRSHYPFVPASKQAIERCLKDFSPRAARLAYASLHVGGALPELLAILDQGSSSSRLTAPPADSVEAKAEKMLSELSWLVAPKRRYRFSFEAAVGGMSIPGFMQVLPSNPWSILVSKLAERLGVNAWGWKLSRLNAQISDLIPRLASRQDLRRYSGKVANWLKGLTPEQRAAWQDLATLSRSLEDDKAADAMAMFICRVATVMYQNHYMALTSLQSMRASTTVLWDLEGWILSDTYTEIRQKLGTQNRVLVPNALQRLPKIALSEGPVVAPREREDETT